MKTVKYILGVSLGLLILFFLERLLLLGSAFDFKNYTTIGWIVQSLLIIFTICVSIVATNAELNSKN
jgi:hypothetical protein